MHESTLWQVESITDIISCFVSIIGLIAIVVAVFKYRHDVTSNNEAIQRNKKKLALKVIGDFYDLVVNNINHANRIIRNSENRNYITGTLINPKEWINYQSKINSLSELQPFVDVITSISEWATYVNSGMADRSIVIAALGPTLNQIRIGNGYVADYFCQTSHDILGISEYMKLMNSLNYSR